MVKLDIKLEEAKQAIGISDFKSDRLLTIALTDLKDLDRPEISKIEQESLGRSYRRLAFLGDSLFDAVLANYLYKVNLALTKEDLHNWRKEVACRESFTEFAIDLGLPDYSSSWNREKRKPPEEEAGVWGEMFEAVVAVIFIDRNRDFQVLSTWLCDRFIRNVVGASVGDPDYESCIVTEAEYLEMIGLDSSLYILKDSD